MRRDASGIGVAAAGGGQLCYAAVAGSGSNPSTSPAPAKEPMKTPSPNSLLDVDYSADGSSAPSSADDAVPTSAWPQAKRKGTGSLGSSTATARGAACRRSVGQWPKRRSQC